MNKTCKCAMCAITQLLVEKYPNVVLHNVTRLTTHVTRALFVETGPCNGTPGGMTEPIGLESREFVWNMNNGEFNELT